MIRYVKQDCSLVGSDILKGISTDRLGNQVRVKTCNGVQTHQVREKRKAMNLEPYEKIILHIGECDVSAGADVKTLCQICINYCSIYGPSLRLWCPDYFIEKDMILRH